MADPKVIGDDEWVVSDPDATGDPRPGGAGLIVDDDNPSITIKLGSIPITLGALEILLPSTTTNINTYTVEFKPSTNSPFQPYEVCVFSNVCNTHNNLQ